MPSFNYTGFLFSQRGGENVPLFYLFYAPVGEVLQWAAIRRLEDEPGAPQRRTSPAKVSAVRKFFSDEPRNTIPTSIVLTIDLPAESIHQNVYVSDHFNLSTISLDVDDIENNENKPGLVIDGQHRLLGMKQFDSNSLISIVALLNVEDDEKAFQFLVINNKSTKVSGDHIRALALSYQEEDLQNRLRAARLSLSPNVDFVGIVDSEECSPFRGIISWPTNPEENRWVVPAAIETAINKIQSQKVKAFESDDVLMEYFYSIWGTIKEVWSSIWTQGSRLLSKVGIICMTEYISEALVSSYDWGRLDISDPSQVKEAVKNLLGNQEASFWTVGWTSASYDTKAGRELIVASLVKIGRNIRGSDVWYEGLDIVDLSQE